MLHPGHLPSRVAATTHLAAFRDLHQQATFIFNLFGNSSLL